MVCQECGKPITEVKFWRHEGDGFFFQPVPRENFRDWPAAVTHTVTLNLHAIVPVETAPK